MILQNYQDPLLPRITKFSKFAISMKLIVNDSTYGHKLRNEFKSKYEADSSMIVVQDKEIAIVDDAIIDLIKLNSGSN